jgi:copper resistance protein C
MLRRLLLAVQIGLGVVTAAALADAHAFLDHARPPAGGRVAEAPALLELLFTEAVVPHFSQVQVTDAQGHVMAIGPVKASNQGRELSTSLPKLAPGAYTVTWHITAADTHKTQGRFGFTVGR